ncbi:hypothetical protein M8J75_002456 [Diaphorina citri]|nr:hypothetical protein M8J75_002456 [Diaphorina citri]KAI5708194.1 hypothetical protein M8J77_017867 [Diaphorina citri]
MNKLRVLSQVKSLGKVVSLQQNSVRTAFVYTPDWLPGERPKTEEERRKAAKKYNLLPEEYEVQPDDGFATGDYPHLPHTHYDSRDPFYPWDYPMFRTNYGEPLPNDFAISHYGMGFNEQPVNQQISVWEQLAYMVGVLGTISLILKYFCWEKRYYHPKFDSPKYQKGVVHYGYHQK